MRGWLWQRWFALAPAAVALGLGMWGIGTPGPWFDEMATVEALTEGLATRLWEAPLLPYYGLMWVWSLGGQFVEVAWLRTPSVLAVSGAAALVAVTARRLSTPRAGLVAGMVLALAPGLSRYGHEARAYALALLLVSAATLALLKAAESRRVQAWAIYAGLLGAATLILPVSLAVLPAHAVLLRGQAAPPPWRHWIMSVYFLLPILVLEAGFAILFTRMHEWLEKPTILSLLEIPALLVASEYTSAAYGLAVLTVGLASPVGRRWIAGLLASVLLVWVVSVTVSNWWLARGFVPLAGMACVAAGVSVARAGWGWVAGVLALLTALSAADHVAIRQPLARGVDPEVIAEVMSREGASGDAVVAGSERSHPWWSVVHYLRDGAHRFSRVADRPAVGRFWVVDDAPPCAAAQSWQVAPDRRLWLCDVPSTPDELDGGPAGEQREDAPGQ